MLSFDTRVWFDANGFAEVTMHDIYVCGQLFACIQLFGDLIFVEWQQMAKQPSASVEMVAQEDQQIASRTKDFMSSLHEAKAEWGFFHMFMAQAVLRRPIHLALPVDGQNTITRYEHDKTR